MPRKCPRSNLELDQYTYDANEIIEDPQRTSEMLREQNNFTQPNTSKIVIDPHIIFSQSVENDLTYIIVTEESVT